MTHSQHTPEKEESDALSGLKMLMEESISNFIKRYSKIQTRSRRASYFLRFMALIGAIASVMISILAGTNSEVLPPQWSAIALIVSGAAVAADRVFGFSRVGARCLLVQRQLEAKLDEFRISWQIKPLLASSDSEEVMTKQVELCATLNSELSTIREAEAKECHTEISSAMDRVREEIERLRERKL